MSQKSVFSELEESQKVESENDEDIDQDDEDLSQINGKFSKESSSSSEPSLRPGFLPAILINSDFDPNLNLIQVLFESHRHDTLENDKFIFESIFSLYALLAYGGLSAEQSRVGTYEACLLLLTHFQRVMDNIHLMTYMQKNFIDFLPGHVIPQSTLSKLNALKSPKLMGKFATLGSKPENKNPAKFASSVVRSETVS